MDKLINPLGLHYTYMLSGCELIDTENHPAEPEYETWWRVREPNESQTSYSVEQAEIFQYQSYSHSDDMFIILKSNINTDTSIFVFSWEKSHDSKYASTKHSS